jgi:putative membrane protein
MKRFSFLPAFAIVCIVSAGAHGGDKPLDKDFLVKAATCNHAEIEVTKLADRRSNSSDVKDLALVIQKEHKAAYEKLGELLKTRKVGVVAGLEKDARAEIKRLGALEGAEFDREFLLHMIREHKTAISIFENQAKNGQEADIRDYAKDHLPDLRKHLKKAEELAKTAGK